MLDMLEGKHFAIHSLCARTGYKWAHTEAGLKELSETEMTVKGVVFGRLFHVIAEDVTPEKALFAALMKAISPHNPKLSVPLLLQGKSFNSMMDAIAAFDAICG